MAVAGADHKGLAFDLGPGTHAHDFKALAVAVVDALDHVGDEGAAKAVAFARETFGGGWSHHDGVLFLADADAVRKGAFQFSLRSLDLHGETVEGDGHLVGDGNGIFADA